MERREKKQRTSPVRILWGLLLLLFGLLLLNHLIYAAIVPMIFFHAAYSEAADMRLRKESAAQALVLDTEIGTLRGWKIGSGTETVVLYFGGDSVDSGAWLDEILHNEEHFSFSDITLLSVDYPTFGKSTGSVSEAAFFQTAELLYDYAITTYPESDVCAIGYSIGSSAALRLSTVRTLDGLILIAPMYDATSLYLDREFFLHDWMEPTATVQMQNDEFAARCPLPALIFASDADQMTKLKDVLALAERFPKEPELVLLADCDHNTYWTRRETHLAIQAYLANLKQESKDRDD